MQHLFVDISAHGFGHFAQTAPLLNALAATRSLRLTLRSGLTLTQLQSRLQHPFTHVHAASDFGFVMHDALNVDVERSARLYREAYANWPQRVNEEACWLAQLQPDLVLSNVSPLPLAGAAMAGIPAIAMCSLNWADLFAHYYAGQAWAPPIHAAMQAAYAGALAFLRLTPGMPMPSLANEQVIGPISAYGQHPPHLSRAEVADRLGLPLDKRWLLLALGGIAHRLPVENWAQIAGVHVLVPAEWQVAARLDCTPYSHAQLPFIDLFPHVDVLLSKPGYGTFVEAACCGLPVLYLRRPDWPEAGYLEDWLHQYARAAVLDPALAASGDLAQPLSALLASPAPARPAGSGLNDALRRINNALDGNDTIAR